MILGFLTTKLGQWIGTVLAALATVAGIFYAGKRKQRQEEEAEENAEYIEVRKKLDEEDPATTADAARKRLRARKRARNL
jgi:hypothetical protein